MRKADIDAAKPRDITLNYQQRTTPLSPIDLAKLPLFKNISTEMLQRGTYAAYLKLIDNYHPNTAITENWTEEQYRAIDEFMDEVMQTKVFTIMWQFLISKGLASEDPEQFKADLKRMWFAFYSRAPGKSSSSGFEHVFCGELRNKRKIVDGLHYWVRYYMLEHEGQVNYLGYLQIGKEIASTIHYNWRKCRKDVGSFLIGTSPEFDFALFTMCYVAKPGNTACKFEIDRQKMAVTSYKLNDTPHIGTSYPVILK
ncbi:unnamed protein product [Soboliphyme baturini]|uniref:Endoribonuclease n=1 Tax=Soboliphyme baturini TaxID=241478 RepID=A0A183I9D0_9BILA|nr:unnamed protein product [Soboliphyme baturini]